MRAARAVFTHCEPVHETRAPQHMAYNDLCADHIGSSSSLGNEQESRDWLVQAVHREEAAQIRPLYL